MELKHLLIATVVLVVLCFGIFVIASQSKYTVAPKKEPFYVADKPYEHDTLILSHDRDTTYLYEGDSCAKPVRTLNVRVQTQRTSVSDWEDNSSLSIDIVQPKTTSDGARRDAKDDGKWRMVSATKNFKDYDIDASIIPHNDFHKNERPKNGNLSYKLNFTFSITPTHPNKYRAVIGMSSGLSFFYTSVNSGSVVGTETSIDVDEIYENGTRVGVYIGQMTKNPIGDIWSHGRFGYKRILASFE